VRVQGYSVSLNTVTVNGGSSGSFLGSNHSYGGIGRVTVYHDYSFSANFTPGYVEDITPNNSATPTPTAPPVIQTPQPPAAGWVGTNYTYTPSHPHAVTTLSGGVVANYQYDENGNTLAPGASAGVTCRVENNETYKQTYNPENRLSTVQKLATGDCTTPLTYSASWSFSYDGDGTRVAQLYTTYDAKGTEQSGVITSYFMGGAYEVTGTNIKKYYREAPRSEAEWALSQA